MSRLMDTRISPPEQYGYIFRHLEIGSIHFQYNFTQHSDRMMGEFRVLGELSLYKYICSQ